MATHDFAERVAAALDRIGESDKIIDHNKALLKEYHRDRKLNGLSNATHQKHLSYLKVVAEHVGDQPLDEMEKSDIKDLVEWTQSRDIKKGTVATYKEIIRVFWTWIHRDDPDLSSGEHPDCVDWITSGDYDSGKLPQDLLTKEDVEAQIEAAYNYRDKAFIAVLWETGARIGELIDLTVGDIEDRGSKGLKVVIDGKTGSRRLPLRGSIPYVNRWLNDHPNPDDDAPLWCKIQQGSPDDQLGYRYIRDKILDKTMNAAEVDKPSNPHHYRHSRASYLANHFTEARLCEWFGWVQGSDVPAKYVHLSGRDLDDAYAELHGDTTSETRTETSVEECPRCGWVNEPDVRFCGECGTDMTLDPEELATPSVSIEDLNEAMKEFFSDPSSKGPVLDAMTEAVRENPEVVQAAVSEMFEGEPSVKKE